jgi:hypothetical protein
MYFCFMESAPEQSPASVASHTSAFCTKPGIICYFLLWFNYSFSQNTLSVDSSSPKKIRYGIVQDLEYSNPNKDRIWLITGINVAAYGGSLIILNNTWYKNYPHTSFHTFNDSKEWLQVDKIGHAWTAYNTGRASSAMWRWAGLSQKKSALIGGLSGTAYLTVIEFLDAYSSKWGWSWSDIGANLLVRGFL